MIVEVFVILLATRLSHAGDVLVLPPDRHQARPVGMLHRLVRCEPGVIDVAIARTDDLQTRDEPRAFILRFTGGDAPGAAIVTAMRWRGREAEVWVANYPGYGQSSGPRSLAMMTSSALAAYDELRRVARHRPIFVEGFSLGTAPALAVAARRDDVAGVIIQNAPPIKQLAVQHFGWWNVYLLATIVAVEVPDDLDSIANAARCKSPAVFLIADHDRTVPPRFQRMISDAYAGKVKRVIVQRGADHVAPLSADEERELSVAMDDLVHMSRAQRTPATRPFAR